MENLELNNLLTSAYRGKRVFVTGHTGFKGSWFITWLGLLGAAIKGYSLKADTNSLFNCVARHINLESVISDIRDRERLKAEIASFQPDFIFHFAAQALVRKSYEIPAETFDVNAIGTANVLQSIIGLKKKCSLIIITTDKVYQNSENGHFYNEDDLLGGHDPYSASKACAEIVSDSFRRSFFNKVSRPDHPIGIATVRAGNVIGGGDWNKDRIIPDIVNSLMNKHVVRVRNPNAVRPWQHVLEPLCGYLQLGALLSGRPELYSTAFNFGPEPQDHLKVMNLVEIAIACWGIGEWEDASDETQPHEAGLLKLDIARAKTTLNWVPKLNSRQAIEWSMTWYKQPVESRYSFTVTQIREYATL